MMDVAATQPDPLANDVDTLLESILTLPLHAQHNALVRICALHPQHADTLRHRHAALAALGLLPHNDEADADDALPQAPRELGDFTLLQRIGSGGMGVVYRARQRSLDREVALKLMRPELAYFEQTRNRLRREADAIARLDHPGILPIHAVDEAQGIPFLVMPLLVGCSIADLLRQLDGGDPSQLDADDIRRAILRERPAEAAADRSSWCPTWCSGDWTKIAVQLALLVAEALTHAHARGIVHRDVKPGNVMLTHDGRVLLLDFGLASAEHAPGITRPGTFMGSMAYTSPEQLQADKVDARTDVFALGVTLYEMLALMSPFAAATTQATAQRVLNHDPPSLQRDNRRVGPDLAAIVRKAIEKAPAARYASMAAFATDLRAWLEHGVISVRPDTTTRRLRRYVQRRPLQATAVALLALTMLTGAGWLGHWLTIERTVVVGRAKEKADAVEAQVLVGFAELAYGKPALARAAFMRALALDGDSTDAATGLALLAPTSTTPPLAAQGARPDVLFRRAAWLLVHGPRDDAAVAREATALMTQALLGSPMARPVYHYKWLEAAGHAGDSASVRAATDAVLLLWPGSARTHFWIGTAWMEHDHDRAATGLRQAIALDPDFVLARAQLGTLLLNHGDTAEAERTLADTAARDPRNVVVWIDLGIARERLGNQEGAVSALRAAVDAEPNRPGAHYNLGRLLEAAGDTDSAVAAYRRTLDLEPGYWEAHQNLGLLLIDHDQMDTALEHLRRLVALQPERAHAHRCLAFACIKAGDNEAALVSYRAVTRLQPDDAEAHEFLCQLLAQRGDQAALVAEKARWLALGKDD